MDLMKSVLCSQISYFAYLMCYTSQIQHVNIQRGCSVVKVSEVGYLSLFSLKGLH